MKKKKVLILDVNSLERQAVVGSVLSQHHVKFAKSVEDATSCCYGADIIALGTNHEKHMPAFFKNGFKGIVLPLLVGKEQGMTVKGKLVLAVPVRELPDVIISLITEKEPEPIAA